MGGGRINELVSLVDMPPTLLDAAGIAVPPEMQGHSILPLVNREKVDWQQEVFVQISESQIGRAIRSKRWKYGVTAPGKGGSSAPGSDQYEEQYLYDLHADPHELTNLAGLKAFRGIADELRQRLIERMVEAGEDAPTIHAAPERDTIQRRLTIDEVRTEYFEKSKFN